MEALDLNELIGKTVTFSTATDTLAIKDCKFKTLNNRVIIVGKIPKTATSNDWAVEQSCAICWDAITDFIVFDDELTYVEKMKKSECREG